MALAIVFGNAFLTQPSIAVTICIESDIIFNNVCVGDYFKSAVKYRGQLLSQLPATSFPSK